MCDAAAAAVVASKCCPSSDERRRPRCCSMFMFRSRRSNLSRRLLKLRRRPAGDETRRLAESVLCRLQDNQLEMMAAAVEGRGAEPSNCVLLPLDGQPHVLCCQLWRWPDVRQADELRRLPSCSSSGDPVYVCCNPYHWSRLCQPGEYTLRLPPERKRHLLKEGRQIRSFSTLFTPRSWSDTLDLDQIHYFWHLRLDSMGFYTMTKWATLISLDQKSSLFSFTTCSIVFPALKGGWSNPSRLNSFTPGLVEFLH